MQLNLASCLIFHVFLPSFVLHNGHFSSSKLMISSSCLSSWSMSHDSLIFSFNPFLIFQNLKYSTCTRFFPWTWDKSPKYKLNSCLSIDWGQVEWFECPLVHKSYRICAIRAHILAPINCTPLILGLEETCSFLPCFLHIMFSPFGRWAIKDRWKKGYSSDRLWG